MIGVSQIAQWCEPWNHLYSHSKLVSGSVTGAHILALVFGGGYAIAADRSTLRAHRRDHALRVHQLDEVAAIHRPVLVALGVSFVSGVLLALADVETFLPSPAFWVKLAFVALLLANGAVLTHTERSLHARLHTGADDDTALWARLRFLAISSVTLWTATAIAGLVLSNVA